VTFLIEAEPRRAPDDQAEEIRRDLAAGMRGPVLRG
jgi:hypothetical protein